MSNGISYAFKYFHALLKVVFIMKKLTTADVKVSRVMTKNLITVSLGSMIEEAVKKMVDFVVECLSVVDSKGFLYGLLTFRDIFCSF